MLLRPNVPGSRFSTLPLCFHVDLGTRARNPPNSFSFKQAPFSLVNSSWSRLQLFTSVIYQMIVDWKYLYIFYPVLAFFFNPYFLSLPHYALFLSLSMYKIQREKLPKWTHQQHPITTVWTHLLFPKSKCKLTDGPCTRPRRSVALGCVRPVVQRNWLPPARIHFRA